MDSRNLFLAAALSGLAFVASADQTAPTPTPTPAMPSHGVTTETPSIHPTPAMTAVKSIKKGKTLSLEGNCHGANSCHTATNSCQGKGIEKMSEKDCKEKKGIFKRE
jgi:hypothetical protein